MKNLVADCVRHKLVVLIIVDEHFRRTRDFATEQQHCVDVCKSRVVAALRFVRRCG